MNKLWAVVTCMSRLRHIKTTLGSVTKQPNVHCLLVDYNCPDRSGDWVEKYHPEASVLRVQARDKLCGRPLFNKSVALNAGAEYAFSHGATHIVFTDADTIIQDLNWVYQNLRDDEFMIPDHRYSDLGLYGFLVVPRDGFIQSGKFDEEILGYGVEDIDMRLRLYYVSKLKYRKIPVCLGKSIPHNDHLRTRNYREKCKENSQRSNIVRMHTHFRDLGIDLEEKYQDPQEIKIIRELSGS